MQALRIALNLALVLCLALPGFIRAQGRDLIVEELVAEFKEKAALWVLTVGVSQYQDERINLRFADHDALRIAQLLKSQEGLLFREVFTQVLINENATREQIHRSMSQFLGQAAPDDVVLIFLAGHGLQDRQTGTYYFVPHNASADNLVYNGLPMPSFEEAVRRLQTNVDKVVLWLDTCHSGAMSRSSRGVNTGEDLAAALKQAEGRYILSASKPGEESLEDEAFRFPDSKRGHGAFTFSLMRGLKGEAADSSGVVWLSDLLSHVSKEVPRLTAGKQHPHQDVLGTDMPLFIVDAQALAQAQGPVDIVTAPVPSAVAPAKGGGKTWLWIALGLVAAGGAGVALGGGDGGGPATGSVAVEVQLP